MELQDLLRDRGATTVGALAHELGVGRRTILRDLATRRARGVPIHGEAGPGGGVRMEGARGLLAVHLSIAELTALWLAAQLSRGTSGLPWGRAMTSGLAKVLASLPAAKARTLRALCRRVVAGPPASAQVRSSAGATSQELLGMFEEAFSAGVGLAFQYRDRCHARARTIRAARRRSPCGSMRRCEVRPRRSRRPTHVFAWAASRARGCWTATPFGQTSPSFRSSSPTIERWRPLTGRW